MVLFSGMNFEGKSLPEKIVDAGHGAGMSA